MASTAPAAATTPTSPPASSGPQPTTTNASSAPPSTTTAAASPSMRSLKDGSRLFDIRMNPYHLKYPHMPPETNPQVIPARLQMPTLTPNVGLSPYHDGRIRNPVPSKLKGKTDGRQGNFSVMQIDVPRPEMTERDLAAKRTSEGTAAAARLANSQGYRHPKRPRPNVTTPAPPVRFRPYPTPVLPAPPRPIPQPPPLAPAIPLEKAPVERAPADKAPAERASAEIPSTSNPPTQATSPSIQEISPPPQAQETDHPTTGPSGLSAHDTKTEQARLLTLLRSLHPILVVDQLCKALAYFGGIPGAPPPADGVFPRSAGTNGSGSLFVAWISEIFPQLDGVDKAAVTQTPPAIPPISAPGAASIANSSAANAAPVTVKRSRGRPKGSKSSKVRKDKGIKKKVVTGSETTQTNDATATQSTPAEQEPEASQPPTTTGDQGQAATTAVAQANSNSTVQPTTPHVGKKRGRPKGSKNKPKSQSGTQNGVYASYAMAANPVIDSPLAHKTASNQQDANSSANVGNTGTGQNGMTTNSVEPEPNGSVLVQEATVASDADDNVDQPPLPTPISTQTTPTVASRKRKPSQQTSQTNVPAMATPNTLQVPDVVSRSGNSPRTQNAKRRRVSEEMGQNVVLSGTESHSTGADASDSPTIVPNGQPSSTSSSFDSQGQINQLGSGINHRAQQLLPHQRQQLQQQQQHQQRQNLNLHQFDQNQQPPPQPQPQPQPPQSPDMGSEQPNQTQQMAPTATNRPRNRLHGTQTHMPNMATQAVYKQHYQQRQQQQQQRQMANHFGQANGPPFSRTMGSNSPTQFQQQQHPTNAALGYSGRPSLSQHQHPQQQQQQQHQQHPQTQPDESPGAPNMAQFQDFNGQGYLDMDYSMNTGTAVGFDSHTQLEAALAEPDMRDRIYHAIGR